VPIVIGSRIFAPRPGLTLLTLAILGLLLSLGRWQLERAAEKRALFDEFSAGARETRPLDLSSPPLPRYSRIEASGSYDSAEQILIDNMASADGRAGYYVVTPFALQGGGWVLVNRGWVPVGASRSERPDVSVASTPRTLHGRTDRLPSPGIRMGTADPLAAPFPVVANFPSFAELSALLRKPAWTRAAELVLLDAGEPDGYLRQWSAPGFPPMRHVAYAVQWFALALALAVIYVVTNLKPREAAPGAAQ
jgi:surfeit locus 1 family protein